jgi:hypothetical protein
MDAALYAENFQNLLRFGGRLRPFGGPPVRSGRRRGVGPRDITITQPKVPETKVRVSQEGFQCVLVSPKRVPGVRKAGAKESCTPRTS